MKLVHQPDNKSVCGQTCVATVAGVSLEKVCKLVGHWNCTKTRELIKVLRKLGFKCGSRLRRMPSAPPLSIAKLKSPAMPKSAWHWVVVKNGTIYDGRNGINPEYDPPAKIVSYLSIFV